MNQIPPHLIWIGSSGATRDLRRHYGLGIRAVVPLAYDEAAPTMPHDFLVLRFPLEDGGGNEPELLRLAIHTVTQLVRGKFATLVCCQAGRSRSPLIVAAALASLKGDPFASVISQLSVHHFCDIHPALLAQVSGLLTNP